MSQFTYFTLSVEKGIRGNLGKAPIFRNHSGDAYADVMLFLVPNGEKKPNQFSQIVNVHFHLNRNKEVFYQLREFGQGDYVQIGFDRIDLTKGINEKSGQEILYVTVKANSIKLLRKADKKEVLMPIKKSVKPVEKSQAQASA